MLQAAQGALAQKWPEAKYYVECEYKKIGETLAFIEAQRALNLMSNEKARMLLEIQKNSTKVILLTVKGLGTLAVEDAILASLDVVKSTVNTALGIVLI
jgi:hypothetical protein